MSREPLGAPPQRAAGPETSRAGRVRSPGLWLAVALAVYLVVSTFPGWYVPLQPGLDHAWRYAISALPGSGAAFGSDLVFSWGPLGYLVEPAPVGSSLVQAAGLWVVAQVGLGAILVLRFHRGRRVLPIVLFAVAYLASFALGQSFDYRLVFLIGALLVLAPAEDRWWRATATAAGVLAGVLLYTKLSSGLSAAMLIAVVGAGWVLRRAGSVREVAGWLWAPYGITVLGLGAVLIGHPGEVARWLSLSLDLGSGYTAAMAHDPFSSVLPWALLGAGVFAVLVAVLWRIAPATALLGTGFLGPAYLALRHSFARHNGRFIMPVLLAAVAILLLDGRSRKALVATSTAFALLVGLGGVVATRSECACTASALALRPSTGLSNLRRVVRIGAENRELKRESDAFLEPAALPASWLEAIGSASVDVIPYELMFLPANDLRWVPNPVLQTYSVFTPRLDRLVAGHFAATGAPEFLIVEYAEIDRRYPTWAGPRMWRSILGHYAPVEVEGSGPYALLRRRSAPADLRIGPVADRASIRPGVWTPVPASGSPLFAEIDLAPTFWGRLALWLWSIPPVLVDVRWDDGAEATYRLLPRTAGGGLLMDPLPRDTAELRSWLAGIPIRRVTAIRLRGGGLALYDDSVTVRWRPALGLPPPQGEPVTR